MGLSSRVVETLLDLVEIKLSCVEIYDREDTREVAWLEKCREELQQLLGAGTAAPARPSRPQRARERKEGKKSVAGADSGAEAGVVADFARQPRRRAGAAV